VYIAAIEMEILPIILHLDLANYIASKASNENNNFLDIQHNSTGTHPLTGVVSIKWHYYLISINLKKRESRKQFDEDSIFKPSQAQSEDR